MRAVLAAGALLLALVLVHVLAHERSQIASTDRVVAESFVSVLTPRSRLCQKDEIVPARTAAIRMTIGTYNKPGPPLSVSIAVPQVAGAARVIATGALQRGWSQGIVRIPIAPQTRSTYGDATVCIRDLGSSHIALAGSTVLGDYGFADYLNGAFVASEVRIDYMLPGRPSWFDMLGRLGYRMTLGKGSYVGWLGWLAPLVLMIAAAALTVRLLLGSERRS